MVSLVSMLFLIFADWLFCLIVDNKPQHLDFLWHLLLIFKYFKFSCGKIMLIRIFLRCDVFFLSLVRGHCWYDTVHFVHLKPVEYFGNLWVTTCDVQIHCSGCKLPLFVLHTISLLKVYRAGAGPLSSAWICLSIFP